MHGSTGQAGQGRDSDHEPRKRIMVDLSVAADSFSGIPQDTRQIFSMLRHNKTLRVSGLLYPLAHPYPLRLTPGGWDAAARIAAGLHTVGLGREKPEAR